MAMLEKMKIVFGLSVKSKNVPEVEFKPLLLHTDTYDIYLTHVGEEENKTYA